MEGSSVFLSIKEIMREVVLMVYIIGLQIVTNTDFL